MTLIILGNHPSKIEAHDGETWAVGSCAWSEEKPKRIDLLFELHKDAESRAEELNKWQCPVYCQDVYKSIHRSIRYPIEQVTKEFKINRDGLEKLYATNTISYMIALAILRGYDIIHMYGVMMAALGEYGVQLPSCEYMIGCARGRGVDIRIHNSNLCNNTYLYGYEP